jgi:hypothetical protein
VWFERFGTLAAIVELLCDADEELEGEDPCYGFGRKGSPVRNLYLGFAAALSGDRELACKALAASMSSGGFRKLSGSDEVDRRIVAKRTELGC